MSNRLLKLIKISSEDFKGSLLKVLDAQEEMTLLVVVFRSPSDSEAFQCLVERRSSQWFLQ